MEPNPRTSTEAAAAPGTPRFRLGKQSSMARVSGGGDNGNGVGEGADGSGEAAGVRNF
jgi:hypothetical protein